MNWSNLIQDWVIGFTIFFGLGLLIPDWYTNSVSFITWVVCGLVLHMLAIIVLTYIRRG